MSAWPSICKHTASYSILQCGRDLPVPLQAPALANAASWSFPDSAAAQAPVPLGPTNTLVAVIRAIEADHTLPDQEKSRCPQDHRR
jgi:hypothetical protein